MSCKIGDLQLKKSDILECCQEPKVGFKSFRCEVSNILFKTQNIKLVGNTPTEIKFNGTYLMSVEIFDSNNERVYLVESLISDNSRLFTSVTTDIFTFKMIGL